MPSPHLMDRLSSVRYAIRLLTRFRLTRGLVVEHGKRVGIVTLGDMAIRVTEER